MKFFISILCIFLSYSISYSQTFGLDKSKRLTQYVVDKWDDDTGLSQLTIEDIKQTSDGIIWLATYDGLVKFDGIKFTTYNSNTYSQFKSDHIKKIYVDNVDNIYVGLYGGGLIKFNPKDKSIITIISSNDGFYSYINDVYQDEFGRVWISTKGGLLYLNSQQNIYKKVNELDNKDIKATICRNDSVFSLYDKSLTIITIKTNGYNDYTFTKYTKVNKEDFVNLYFDSLYTIVVVTKNSIYSYTNNKFNLLYRSKYAILSSLMDIENTLFIGTNGGGLFRLNRGIVENINSKNDIECNVISTMYQDKEGSLWLGTIGNGIIRLKNTFFSPFGINEGLPVNIVYSIEEDDYNIYVGLVDGGLSIINKRSKVSYQLNNKLLNKKSIISIYNDYVTNILYIGTINSLFEYNKNTKILIVVKELNGFDIRSIVKDSRGIIWIGTNKGLYYKKGNDIKIYDDKKIIGIKCIKEDNYHNLWIGTIDGLYSLNLDKNIISNHSNILIDSKIINCITIDNNNRILIATQKGIIIYKENNKTRYLLPSTGFPQNVSYKIIQDKEGVYWFTTNNGIMRISNEVFNSFFYGKIDKITIDTFSKLNGMRNSECCGGSQNSGLLSMDGTIYIPTVKGLVYFNSSAYSNSKKVFPAIIEKITAAGKEYSPLLKDINLGEGDIEVVFNFTSGNLFYPQKVNFKCKIDNFDNTWINLYTDREITYVSMPPGDYTFKLITTNSDGILQEIPTEYKFHISKKFSQTSIFYVIICVLVIIVLFYFYVLRIISIKSKNERLTKIINEKTFESRQIAQQLIFANEEVHQQNLRLIEVNNDKNDFLGIVAHDLKNPLSYITNMCTIMKENYATISYDNMIDYFDTIIKSGEKMFNLIDNLLDINKIENGKFALIYVNTDINTIVRNLIHTYQSSIANKGIILHFNETDLLVFEVDPEAFEQVVDNILSNAIKYSYKDKNIYVDIYSEDDYGYVTIKDEGDGLSEEDQKKLFKKFMKLTTRPTAGEHSTGLGLSIAKKLTNEMKGDIYCESTLGVGSAFFIKFKKLLVK